MTLPALAFLAGCLLVGVAGLEQVSKDIASDEDWIFIGRFCYDSKGGTFKVSPQGSYSQSFQTFCFYSDFERQWPRVYPYRHSLSCPEKEAVAARCVNITDIHDWWKGLYELEIRSTYPRWWFVTLSNCYPPPNSVVQGVALDKVTISYQNPNNGRFQVEFSKDQHGIPVMCIIFLCIDIFLVCCFMYAKKIAKIKQLSYVLLRLIIVSLCFAAFGLAMQLIHYVIFDKDGQGLPGFYVLAFIADGVSQMVLLGTLVDLSRGYTISTNYVPRRMTYSVLTLYMFLHVMLYLWDVFVSDRGEVVYLYESVPGYILMVLRLVIMLYCVRNLNDSYTLEGSSKRLGSQQRRRFYACLMVFTLCWFLSLPIATWISSTQMDYNRNSIMYGVTHIFDTISYITLLAIFYPANGSCIVSVLDPEASVAFGNSNNMQIFPEEGGNRNFDSI